MCQTSHLNRTVLCAIVLGFFLWGWRPVSAASETRTADVIVYGGTGGGIIAAVKAGRMGKTVILIEPSRHIGGVTSGGLTATDMGNRQTIGGLTRGFYERVLKHYKILESWKYGTFDEYADSAQGKNHVTPDAMFAFEPHVAERIFNELAGEAKVEIVLGERLDLKKGVSKKGLRITAIRMESGKTYAGKEFIDATYEGDLMARAGVTYTVGREAADEYGEKTAGVHPYTGRSSKEPIDPYFKVGIASSGVIPGIDTGPSLPVGSADHRVQAYNYRFCLTQIPAYKTAFEKPADYDEKQYELLFRCYEGGATFFPLNPVEMPNGKADANNNGIFSTDYVGMSDAYPEADYSTREKIAAAHVRYMKGLLWTIANHPRIPAEIREQAAKWGYAKDEFVDNGNWPYALYVREARRMVGAYVMTEQNVMGSRSATDPVALGSYNMDCHMTRRFLDSQGYLKADGGLASGRHFVPYGISYRSLTPKAGECENLLVPVCLSSSHSAYGSIRMEPVYMMLGEACGIAASMAIDADKPVQDVAYPTLRDELLAGHSILEWPPPWFTGVRAKSLPGLVMDDSQAQLTGKWHVGGNVSGVDGEYLQDGNDDKGKLAARYAFTIPADGNYEVRVAYVAHANRANNVPVVIDTADGPVVRRVDQRKTPPIDGLFISLGVYRFSAKSEAAVTIGNEGTEGYVVIDAVQLLPVK